MAASSSQMNQIQAYSSSLFTNSLVIDTEKFQPIILSELNDYLSLLNLGANYKKQVQELVNKMNQKQPLSLYKIMIEIESIHQGKRGKLYAISCRIFEKCFKPLSRFHQEDKYLTSSFLDNLLAYPLTEQAVVAYFDELNQSTQAQQKAILFNSRRFLNLLLYHYNRYNAQNTQSASIVGYYNKLCECYFEALQQLSSNELEQVISIGNWEGYIASVSEGATILIDSWRPLIYLYSINSEFFHQIFTQERQMQQFDGHHWHTRTIKPQLNGYKLFIEQYQEFEKTEYQSVTITTNSSGCHIPSLRQMVASPLPKIEPHEQPVKLYAQNAAQANTLFARGYTLTNYNSPTTRVNAFICFVKEKTKATSNETELSP